MFLLIQSAAFSQAGPCEAQTDKGPVSGLMLEDNNVCAYLGVPYAAPPVGGLRFALPAEHEPWTAPLETKAVGKQCHQTPSPMTDTSIPMDEDCLHLFVWQPVAGDGPKPVMIYIHGGGFIVGSGGNASYNGATLAQRGDVVVVTINYRLGVAGFLAHPAFADANGRTGNWGLYDQLAALKWVKKNIANFGGDPENVTLFGQSAGGMSVGLQLASPLAEGLFQKAMIHSGPPIVLNVGMEKGRADALEVAGTLGCSDPAAAAECLRALPAEKLRDGVPLGIFIMDDGITEKKFFLLPVIDGEIIPDSPYKLYRDGKFHTGVSVVLGTTKDEAAYFTLSKTLKEDADFMKNFNIDFNGVKTILGIDLTGDPAAYEKMYPVADYPSVQKAYQDLICDVGFTCPMELMGEMIAKRQPDVYRFYHTKDPIKVFGWGAFHGSELPYVFGNFNAMGQNFKSKENMALSKKVIALWSAFAHTGSPQADGLPEWPKYDAASRSYMVIGDDVRVETGLMREKCAAIEKVMGTSFTE